MAIKLRAPRRRSAFGSRLIWLLLAIVALYSAAWFGAVKLAGPYVERWAEAEAARGRQWSCTAPAVSGFPFGLRLACTSPALTLGSDAGASSFSAKSMLASFDVFAPSHVAVAFEAPVTAKLKNGDTVLFNARDIKAVVELQSGGAETALRSLSLTSAAPDLAVTSAAGRSFAARAASARLSLTAVPAGHDVAFDAEGTKIPALEALTQNPAPATLHVAGLLEKFDLPGHGGIADRLERWRVAGGILTLDKSTLGNGTTQVEISGPLALDEEHRPAGKLALRLRGGGVLLQRFGVSANLLNAGGLIGALLGKTKKPDADTGTAADAQGGLIALPLTLQGGKLQVGPFPLPTELRPLY